MDSVMAASTLRVSAVQDRTHSRSMPRCLWTRTTTDDLTVSQRITPGRWRRISTTTVTGRVTWRMPSRSTHRPPPTRTGTAGPTPSWTGSPRPRRLHSLSMMTMMMMVCSMPSRRPVDPTHSTTPPSLRTAIPTAPVMPWRPPRPQIRGPPSTSRSRCEPHQIRPCWSSIWKHGIPKDGSAPSAGPTEGTQRWSVRAGRPSTVRNASRCSRTSLTRSPRRP